LVRSDFMSLGSLHEFTVHRFVLDLFAFVCILLYVHACCIIVTIYSLDYYLSYGAIWITNHCTVLQCFDIFISMLFGALSISDALCYYELYKLVLSMSFGRVIGLIKYHL